MSQICAFSQNYGHKLVGGWASDKVLVKNGQLHVFGLGAQNGHFSRNHFLVRSDLDSNLKVIKSQSYPENFNDDKMYSTSGSFAYKLVDSTFTIGGVYLDTLSDTTLPSIFMISDDSFKKNSFNYGYQAYITDLHTSSKQTFILGHFRETSNSDERLKGFLRRTDTSLRTKFICSNTGYPQGCEFQMTHLNHIDSGFLLTGTTYSAGNPEIRDPIILRTDSFGNERWRLHLKNDSLTGINAVTVPLANGNFLVIYCDYQWKPNKYPPLYNNRHPEVNDNANFQLVEFTAGGKVVSTKTLKHELRFIGNSFKYVFINHAITEGDGSIIIVGTTYDSNTKGFCLKLDHLGNFVWYRLIDLDLNGAGEKQELRLNSVTSVNDRNYVLAGEYRSIGSSDSLPNGIQSGIVILLDNYGCHVPDCQKVDNVPKSKQKTSPQVYPNPSSGILNFNTGQPFSFQVQDGTGKIVFEGESSHDSLRTNLPRNLANGVYVISVKTATARFHKKVVLMR